MICCLILAEFDIYFIAKGDNFVTIRDTQKKEYKNFKKLVPGDHFGVRIDYLSLSLGNKFDLSMP